MPPTFPCKPYPSLSLRVLRRSPSIFRVIFVFAPWDRHNHFQIASIPSLLGRFSPNDTPFRFPTMTSAVVALTPKETPSSHMHVNFPNGPPARFLFHKIPSANAVSCTFADLPFSLSYAVFPSRPTSNLVNRNPACSAIHGQTECVASIFSPHRPSMSLRHRRDRPLNNSVALRTANWTVLFAHCEETLIHY